MAYRVHPLPTVEYLRECFTVQDGKLYWRKRPLAHFFSARYQKVVNCKYVGKRAGTPSNRRHIILIDKVAYDEKRLLYKLTTGCDPVDGAQARAEARNNRRAESANLADLPPNIVYQPRSGTFLARGVWQGTQLSLGTFKVLDDAIAARARFEANPGEYVSELAAKRLTSKSVLPTIDYLRECFSVHHGDLFWKERPRSHFNTAVGHAIFNGNYAGHSAGSVYKGRKAVSLLGRRHLVSVILTALKTGERWPKHGGATRKVLFDALPPAARSEVADMPKPTPSKRPPRATTRRAGKDCPYGVSYVKSRDKWRVFKRILGVQQYLGYYDTQAKAVAVLKGALEIYGLKLRYPER